MSEKYPTDAQPVMFVFNRKGEKVKEFGGKAKIEEIEELIAKLLAENERFSEAKITTESQRKFLCDSSVFL